MSRKRSSDPTVGIRITVPRSVLDELHMILSIGESRSAWIAEAIAEKLQSAEIFTMADANLAQRWSAFKAEASHERVWIEPTMVAVIDSAINGWKVTSSNPSEEV